VTAGTHAKRSLETIMTLQSINSSNRRHNGNLEIYRGYSTVTPQTDNQKAKTGWNVSGHIIIHKRSDDNNIPPLKFRPKKTRQTS